MSSQATQRSSTLVPMLALIALVGSGCASFGESGQRDALTAQVGIYPPPPMGLEKARVGVPQFVVTGSGAGGHLDEIAAEQLTTLAFHSNRFDVIERAQLQQLLDEQNLAGVVTEAELAASGEIRGVEYLFLGKVTNLRVRRQEGKRGFSLGRLPFGGAEMLNGVGYEKADIRITAECGVDLRLVEPGSGRVVVAHFGEFKRTDSASALALGGFGVSSSSEVEIQLSEDDKGKILRLALDDALRKMLPRIDQTLAARSTPKEEAPAVAAADPAPQPVSTAARFCSGCGDSLVPNARFCGGCGKSAGE